MYTQEYILNQVNEVRQRVIETGILPIHEVDSRAYEFNWRREIGDLVLFGVTYGTNTVGFKQGIVKYQEC